MKHSFLLCAARAAASRAGTKVQHRIPRQVTDADPIQPGDIVEFWEVQPHGKRSPVGTSAVVSVTYQRLEDISDHEIHAEGYPNWSVMAFDWGRTYKDKQNAWEVNPEIAVISFSRL